MKLGLVSVYAPLQTQEGPSPHALSPAGGSMACLLRPEGELTPAPQMHSFKTCAHLFGHLNGLARIDVFSAPPCEGRSPATSGTYESWSLN